MPFDLLPARARCFKILLRVAFDLGLAAGALFDLVAQSLQPQGKLRAVDCRSILLRTVKLSRLQCACLPVLAFGDVEEHDVRMQLWGCIAIHWPAAVMFKLGGNPFPGGLCRAVGADA